ncbi:GNAT family N-acetyltransferase [Bacillus mesophilum]|uniref:GNAT family N-acetyltransferase n=1 Tax=Bacillus mesophilum TaxID=1071718 RepID=A0A7V7RJY6_9BACI|nr:GNAT family N-acetyltransferase [Bacillus mesophilum]KAB2331388.1 GNAT family N-acetyltransferase [Bacillus mesophilum]
MIIREFKEKDKLHIKELSKRFSDFNFMNYRDKNLMEKKQVELANAAIEKNKANIFVAEENEEFMGYIELAIQEDFFTGEKQGYISSIAVLPGGEGKGIGKKLMKKAEEWTSEQGLKVIVLDVFKNNQRAVGFYEVLGYQQEIVKMTKEISK